MTSLPAATVALDGFSTAEHELLSAALADAGLATRPPHAAALLIVCEGGGERWRAALRAARRGAVLVAEAPARKHLEEVIELGGVGYLRLPATPAELPSFVSALRFALEGQFVCEERLVRALVEAAQV